MRASLTVRALLLTCAALAAGTGCNRARALRNARPGASSSAPAHAAGTAPGAWYDAAPLLVSLRPAARADLARTAGVAHLEDLPLYDLALGLDAAAPGFALHEQVWFTNNENAPLDEVVLRVYANAAGSGTGAGTAGHAPLVSFVRGECEGGAHCTVTAESPSVIAVHPAVPIPPGGRLRIAMDLRGTFQRIDSTRTNVLAQGLEGLTSLGAGEGAGDYGLLAVGDSIASMANFYPVLARRRAGAWERTDGSTMGDLGSDEIAHVRAHIDVASTIHVATTGVTTGEVVLAGGAQRHIEVAAAMVRDFAIMASPNLQSETRNVGGVEVRSHFLPAERVAGLRVLDTAAAALTDFERRFGPYPYADLDVVEAALVGGAGGVEFAGLVTVASMLYRPAIPTTGPFASILSMLGAGGAGASGMTAMMGSMLEFVTAHEVGHQWWHGLVGSDSRLHPYLDEGLAQFAATLYLEDRYGAARARQDADTNVRLNYQAMRLLGMSDAAVDRPVGAFGSPVAYAGLVYGKGPYMYRALRDAVGDAVFFDTLRAYVHQYSFRVAPPRAFVDMLAMGTNAPRVRALATRWLDEAHGDDDLGRVDINTLMASVLGPGFTLPPEVQSMISVVTGLLGGGAGGSGHAPGGTTPQQSLEEIMRQLEQVMNGG